MAAIQAIPNLPHVSHFDQQRRLPPPIHLPPLAIPHSSGRLESGVATNHSPALPPLHTAPLNAAPRSQPRGYGGPAAPLEKLLSPQPFTPPRSDHSYSPLRSPPRSAVEHKPHSRHASEGYPSLEPRAHMRHSSEQQPPPDSTIRAHRSDFSYATPIEPPRMISYSSNNSQNNSFPSPASAHSAGHHSATQPYRQASSFLPPPRPVSTGSQTHLSHTAPYPEPPSTSVGSSLAVAVSATTHYSPEKRFGSAPWPRIDTQLLTCFSPLKYILKVRQQPIAARACGFGERDRRVIDPPPIIQLEVRDPKDNTVDLDELRYSLNVVHCTLWNAEGTCEETALVQPDRRTTRRLMGQLVASPSVAKDEHDIEGCFFCFPDLSCRTHGKYRLRFVLMRIDPMNLHVGGWSPILTDVLSEPFTVYTAKDFPGMRPSSALTRALKLQGCNIQVKKGNEKALARKRQLEASDEEEDLEGGKKRRRD